MFQMCCLKQAWRVLCTAERMNKQDDDTKTYGRLVLVYFTTCLFKAGDEFFISLN